MSYYWFGVFFGIVIGFSGYDLLVKVELINTGMQRVASGQCECALETKEDKTKDLVCAEVVSEQS